MKLSLLMSAVCRRVHGLMAVIRGIGTTHFKSLPIFATKPKLICHKGGNIEIGKEFSAGSRFEISSFNNVSIGDGVFFNNDCSITCLSGVIIGNNCIFGKNVQIYDHNHAFNDSSRLIKEQGFNKKQIVIGDNVWIGSNVVILKGVSIGSNCVIGAGCVVFKSIPENTVVKVNQDLLYESIIT